MQDYMDSFWTEDRLITQHATQMNILDNPDKFPRADLDRVGEELFSVQSAMTARFIGSVKTFRILTGQG